ncbi:hypothetical protein BOTBODRAFT_130652 [Botryobasidium botryosum FD-172 SS1]|uniref:Enoyl reductase (ER) domain-containing protein n=1 Tax=Botryobasidium botryosum (strain FD-172 SS1) TaxID=930990 RepID=A0A067MJH2_BOTB1|nr:hypothetical protein BOTBODRAFT_130652 [Botryobasidium botryosum FD-172 SS1]
MLQHYLLALKTTVLKYWLGEKSDIQPMSITLPETSLRIFLAERPSGHITSSTFASERIPLPTPSEGEVLVRVDYVSLDPAMRFWLDDVPSYIPPVQIGETMRAGGLATVVKGGKLYKEGDLITGFVGWSEYAVVQECMIRKITPTEGIKELDYLGPLGATGLTAYFGLLHVAQLKAGETLVVSAAAGAVGSVVCQIGKLKGARVIGLAGSEDKCAWLRKEIGVDHALNYKDKDFAKEFVDKVGYLDVFFDNVGGDILDLALTRLNQKARITVCGAISVQHVEEPKGPTNYAQLIIQRARMEGFVVFDFYQQFDEAVAEMSQWMREGSLKRKFHIEEGLEKCPEYLPLLYSGGNTGKLLVKVSKDCEF